MPENAIPLFNNQGFIALIDKMGSDKTVVNSARVSFSKKINEIDPEKDSKLIDFLAEHQHYSPFRHCQLQFHLKAPEMLMRQAYKHVVGIEWTSMPTKDHAWNEISGRYVVYEDFYEPEMFRPQSENNKQASEDGDLSNTTLREFDISVKEAYKSALDYCKKIYSALLEAGVAKEQARLVLPFSTFTEVYWTCSLQAAVHFVKLREHSGAQWEIRNLANAMKELIHQAFPLSYNSLIKHI